MKKLYILFLLPLFSFSQQFNQKKVDSLLVVVNSKKQDTAKVNTYQLICQEYDILDLEKVKLYNKKILELSKKANYELGYGFYYHFESISINEDNAKTKIDPLIKASKIFLKHNEVKMYVGNNAILAQAYLLTGKKKDLKKIIKKNISIGLKNNFFSELGLLYTILGSSEYNENLLKDALVSYKKALTFYNKSKKNENNAHALYLYMAFIETDLCNYKQSLYYLDVAKKIAETVSVNLEIALVESKMKNYSNALKILYRNKKLKMTSYEDRYNSYLIGENYYNLKHYTKAITILNSIEYKIFSNSLELASYNLLCKSYLKLHNYKKAKEFNDNAKNQANTTSEQNMKKDFYLCKIEIAEATGNYKEAFLVQKEFTVVKDKNFTKLNNDKINELQINFEVAEKDNNIKNLKIAQLQKTNQINKQNSYITYGIIFILFILLAVLIFTKLYQTIKKKNSLISINNNELENAKAQLEKSVQVKETLLKEIHHRVKNNLQLVMSLLYIQSKEKDKNMDDFLEISQSRIIAMALIHENLYQTEDLSKVDFKEYANSLTQSIIASYNNLQKDIQLIIEIDSIYLDIQTAIPLGLIINELISNAYKHAFVNDNKGIITLQLVQNENDFELVVKDNGVGMTVKKITKKSLGLELVQQLVSQIQGSLQVQDILGLQYQIQFQNIAL